MYSRRLLATALVYSVVHHLGLLPDGLGVGPDGTRWADWLDLAVPWLVLGAAASTLHAAGASERVWTLFAVGAVAYASGHGIHLAGNSVANAAPGPTAHLWDEVVGHALWYAGVALVGASLVRTTLGRPVPTGWGLAAAVVASLGVGLTWATNALGGGPLVPSLVVAVLACGYGWLHRRRLTGLLLVGFVPAVAVLTVALVASAG